MATENLAIFDIDGTLIRGQSQKSLLMFLYSGGYISHWYYFKIMIWFILYQLHFIDSPKKVMEYAFSVFKNTREDRAKEIIDEYFELHLKYKFYNDGLKLIEQLRGEGYRIILISNAIDLIVERIEKYLKADDSIGTTLEVVDGRLTGKIDGSIVYGLEKKRVLEEYSHRHDIKLSNASAYGDHISDVSMLELVGHPSVVNPSNSLSSIATKKGWPILIFKN